MEYVKLSVALGLAVALGLVGVVSCGSGSSTRGNGNSSPDSSSSSSGGGTGGGGDDDAAVDAASFGDVATIPVPDGEAVDAMALATVATRIFKSPGGSIIFQWPQAADAVSYELLIDGKSAATAQGNVPFASVPVLTIAPTFGADGGDEGAGGAPAVHTWSVNTTTAAGVSNGPPTQFELAEAVDGTTGAELGGAGSGSIKFCPNSGQF